MNNELDLSDLLQESPVPEDGAASARRIAMQRRHRRQTIVGGLSALTLVAAATALVLQANPFDDKTVVIRDAGSSNETTTTVVETTTTSTTLDPRQRYVGLEHDDRGGGLPLGAEIRMFGTLERAMEVTDYPEGTGRTEKLGETFAFWIRDDEGDMLWIDTVTKVPPSYDQALHMKVKAVFDLPAISQDDYICIGWCGKSDGTTAANVIGIYSIDSKNKEKFSYAARVDIAKLTLIEIPTTGLTAWPAGQPGPEYPARPDLYSALPNFDQSDRDWILAHEGVSIGGGGMFDDVTYYSIDDHRDNKEVFLVSNTANKKAWVVVDAVPNGNFNFGEPSNFTHKGKREESLLVYTERNAASNDEPIIRAAWSFDSEAFTFTKVSIQDVAFAPTTTTP